MKRKTLFLIFSFILVLLLTGCEGVGSIQKINIDEQNKIKEDSYIYVLKEKTNDEVIGYCKGQGYKKEGIKIINKKEYIEFSNKGITENMNDIKITNDLIEFFNSNESCSSTKNSSSYSYIDNNFNDFNNIIIKTAKPIIKTNGVIQNDGSVLFDLFNIKESRRYISFNKKITNNKNITFVNVKNGLTYTKPVDCQIKSDGIITDIRVNGCPLMTNHFYAKVSGTYTIAVKLSSGVNKTVIFKVNTKEKYKFNKSSITKEISDKKIFKNEVINTFGIMSYSSGNKKVATVNEHGEIKVTGIGTTKIYGKCKLGTISMTLTVIPNKSVISKVKKKSSTSISINIKRDKTVTGYQIIYSKDSKFKKGNKIITIKSNNKTSNTITKLSKKSKYYVKVRCYKTVSKKNYYSNWSSAKFIKL